LLSERLLEQSAGHWDAVHAADHSDADAELLSLVRRTINAMDTAAVCGMLNVGSLAIWRALPG
jgi:hypothetical protein